MKFTFRLAGFLLRTAFKLMYRLELDRLPSLPDEPLLLIANHQSNVDPPFIGSFHPREMHFVAKKQLFAKPLFAALIRHLNAIPIDRTGVDRQALKEISACLAAGDDLLVFPEGTRSRDGKLGKARHGAGMILALAKVSVLPVYIDGSRHRPGFLFRRPTIKLRYGSVLDWKDLSAGLDDVPRSERAAWLTEKVFQPLQELAAR